MLIPVISILLGLLYIIKPGIFRTGLKRGTTTPSESHLLYVRILGVLFLGIGIWTAIERLN
ncbi:MAG TPA: hypothetical protein VM935_05955 [Chitinophagaceae bacterium]|nr:hypothetical protein [Chitinophagaceae bacterium]